MKLFFRNYEEYYPINNEPGFSFTPPIINEEISFNISSNTLDDGQNYFYDVDSGSYSQLECACGFQDGDNEGLSDASEIVLNIKNCKCESTTRVYYHLKIDSTINYTMAHTFI